jgi:hypothetical protein
MNAVDAAPCTYIRIATSFGQLAAGPKSLAPGNKSKVKSGPMNRLVLCLFTVSVALFAAAQTGKTEWKELIYASDGFALTAPYPPLPHADAQIPDTNTYTVNIPQENSSVTLRVMRQPRNCDATFKQFKDLAKVVENHVDISSLKDLTIDGYPGLEYRAQSSDTTEFSRYYCVNGQFYAFTTRWPSKSHLPVSIARVMDSFRLVKADSQ